VRLVVRGSTLVHGASEYLLERLEASPNVTVELNSEVIEASDEHQLRSIVVRNRATGKSAERRVAGLFIMIGAVPRTDWLPAEVARDAQGFVLTGDDGPHPLTPEQFRLPFETTMPGVFASGDVRAGSVKRVAAAVGEGSAAVQQVLHYLARKQATGSELLRAVGEPMPVGISTR
jgi:thioredoxin reductase (NADPH)